MNAEYKISYLSWLGENLVHITIGEKNFKDSPVSFPPQGRSCMKSVFSHTIKLRKDTKRKNTKNLQVQDLFNVPVLSNAFTSAYLRPRGIKLLKYLSL